MSLAAPTAQLARFPTSTCFDLQVDVQNPSQYWHLHQDANEFMNNCYHRFYQACLRLLGTHIPPNSDWGVSRSPWKYKTAFIGGKKRFHTASFRVNFTVDDSLLPIVDSLLRDGDDIMDVPWSSSPQLNTVEVIWYHRQRPQVYLAQISESLEDGPHKLVHAEIATEVLATANIPAKDIKKATFIENDVEYHEAGDFLINTDDKLSTQGMIKDSVIIHGRTFNLKLIRRTALQRVNNTDGLSTIKTAKDIYCQEMQAKMSYKDTLLMPRDTTKRKSDHYKPMLPTTPTGVKVRAVSQWDAGVLNSPHYTDQEAAQALLTMQE